MNRNELIDKVAADTETERPQTEAVLMAFFATLADAARTGNRVSWPNFGTFSVTERAARTGRNPRTGEPVQIPAGRVLRFSQANALRAHLNP